MDMTEKMSDKNNKQTLQQLIAATEDWDVEKILPLYMQLVSYGDVKRFFDDEEMLFGDTKERCMWILNNAQIDFENHFAVGIVFGGVPEIVSEKERSSYQEFVLTTFAFYSRIAKEFSERNIGFEVHRTAYMLHMVGVFPLEHKEDFVSVYLEPLHKLIEEQYQVKICVGVGMTAEEKEQLYNAYRTAQYAHELYFFRQQPIIEFQKLEKQFERSPNEFEVYLEDAFHAILIKEPDVLDKIDRVTDIIGEIHFGNWQAVLMRIMMFTGDLTSKLQRYKLFRGDFYKMQDELQKKVLNSKTFPQAKKYVHDYYAAFLPYIYNNGPMSSKATVEQVKTYIQENFMEELSIQRLAEVACVSPNYFSHMFKNEVGQNYKEYLTHIRMEKAVDLILNTDYPLYKISEAVGYNNTRTFVDAFKQVYGDSPTKYKKKIQKK